MKKYEVYFEGAQIFPYDPCIFDTREDAEYQVACMLEVGGYTEDELEIVETEELQDDL